MWVRVVAVGITLGTGLACGGAGGLVGSSVGEYAASYAEYVEKENPGIACPTSAVGSEVRLGDFTYRIDEVLLVEAEKDLPWIQNSDERRTFGKEGVKGLVVVYSVRNESPVKAPLDVWFRVYTTDGEQGRWGAYNEKFVQEERGLDDLPTKGMPAGTWVQTAGVLAVNPAAVDGAAAYLFREEEQFDPTDPRGRRKIDVLLEHAVVDLGTPAAGPHINPEKRTP